ncbi:MAG: hypothetical protein KA327_00830, partial [Pseudarcicella sp.]|nr:hypothetical protein [Pseudarcicella sp.]
LFFNKKASINVENSLLAIGILGLALILGYAIYKFVQINKEIIAITNQNKSEDQSYSITKKQKEWSWFFTSIGFLGFLIAIIKTVVLSILNHQTQRLILVLVSGVVLFVLYVMVFRKHLIDKNSIKV